MRSPIIFEQPDGNESFAIIRSKGDQALFGKSTRAMKAQWKIPDARPLADFAPTIILKARDFAAEITIFNSRDKCLGTESAIFERDILKLPIPMIDKTAAKGIIIQIQQAHQSRQEAQALLASAKRGVEVAIEKGETAAFAYVKSATPFPNPA